MPAKKTTEVSTVTLKHFYAMPDKGSVKIAGIIKEVEDKETPFGVAKRFRGDIALAGSEENYRAKNIFLPDNVRDSLLSEVKKIGKWESFEFVIIVTKNQAQKDADATTYSVKYILMPRIEIPHVLSLLEA